MSCFLHVLYVFYSFTWIIIFFVFVFDRATTVICFCFCTFFLSQRQRLLHLRSTMKNQHLLGSPFSILTATKLRNGKGGCRLVMFMYLYDVMFRYLHHQRFEKILSMVTCKMHSLDIDILFWTTCMLCLPIFLYQICILRQIDSVSIVLMFLLYPSPVTISVMYTDFTSKFCFSCRWQWNTSIVITTAQQVSSCLYITITKRH